MFDPAEFHALLADLPTEGYYPLVADLPYDHWMLYCDWCFENFPTDLPLHSYRDLMAELYWYCTMQVAS